MAAFGALPRGARLVLVGSVGVVIGALVNVGGGAVGVFGLAGQLAYAAGAVILLGGAVETWRAARSGAARSGAAPTSLDRDERLAAIGGLVVVEAWAVLLLAAGVAFSLG